MKKKKLYKSYKNGYLKVSDGYKIYYELYGNPRGKPVIFVHGGPGGGFSKEDKRFFNPKIFNVILFDQRGSGKSKPFASLKANTTAKLVQDMKKLLEFLGIKKIFLFGGSWGSTLSLVYAIKHPETISGILLRGIFLGTDKEIRYSYNGGVKRFFPEIWERFISNVPGKYRKNPVSYYLKKMKSKNPKVKEKYTFEWAYYEMSLLKLKSNQEEIKRELKRYSYKSLAPIEAHYFKNHCFLPDNYILKNAYKLSKIPISIIQGRYDFVCPPINAYKLHKKLKNSKLHFVFAGHSSSEKEIEKKLISEMNRFSKII